MNTLLESLKSFLTTRTETLYKGQGLSVKLFESSLLISGKPDERIGSWAERYKNDLIAFKSENPVDITVIVEESQELDSTAFVYVLISKVGDTTALKEIKKIEKDRKGVYYFDIQDMPELEDFTNVSAISQLLQEKCESLFSIE